MNKLKLCGREIKTRQSMHRIFSVSHLFLSMLTVEWLFVILLRVIQRIWSPNNEIIQLWGCFTDARKINGMEALNHSGSNVVFTYFSLCLGIDTYKEESSEEKNKLTVSHHCSMLIKLNPYLLRLQTQVAMLCLCYWAVVTGFFTRVFEAYQITLVWG